MNEIIHIKDNTFLLIQRNVLPEFGRCFQVNYDLGHDERAKIMSLAIMDAKHDLPKGAVFEIRTHEIPKDETDYKGNAIHRDDRALKWGIAWYHVPEPTEDDVDIAARAPTPQSPLFINDIDDGIEHKFAGCLIVARIKNE